MRKKAKALRPKLDDPQPPPPSGNKGQLNATLVAGIEALDRNRPDATQIIKNARGVLFES